MNKLLNNALRAKGYAGPDIKMVLTDVTDPNGPYYTDTLTNVVVFDRKVLASLDRDKILNILGHEFGHYSKEDNKTGNQTIANYTGDKLEDRTKAMVAKEATEDTLASIRNNPNVITGDEGKKLAESIPMDRREYVKWGRVLKGVGVGGFGLIRMVFAYGEINLGGPIGWGHGGAQGFFGLSETIEGLDHIRLGFKDIDEDEKPAFSLSKTILGDSEEFTNMGVAMTTEHAIVYAKAFSSVPSMLKMLGNKSSSYVKLEQGVSKVSKNGIDVVAEDLTAVKVGSSNNKNTVTQIGKNSKEVVLYEDKNSKITVDVKDVFIEDTGTTKSTNINQQVNKGTTSNNQKGEGVSKISITKDKSGTNQIVADNSQKSVYKNGQKIKGDFKISEDKRTIKDSTNGKIYKLYGKTKDGRDVYEHNGSIYKYNTKGLQKISSKNVEEVYSKDYNEAGNTTPDSEITVSSYEKLEKGYSNGKYVDKKKLTNGKIRYYEKAKPANNPAEHKKETRLVIEYNPETDQKRAWLETIDSDNKVRMVRPEKNNNTKTHYEFDKNGKYIGTKEEREMRNSKKEEK
ncbi:hypothetical protein HMPREF0400_01996 [Fusobacterium periodonticum 1_1_41FAA]|uniref:Hemolysin n=1 Tax=Fusobacterium periodonticum 1_1_41FAA TaxID=469621 RepID=D6LJG4_9FUSO|nr:hypothetical protein HMPREF0400_01996 [Fusobacterium periodonticum 1_1_41FAA]